MKSKIYLRLVMNNKKSYKLPNNFENPENLSNFNHFSSHNESYPHSQPQTSDKSSFSADNSSRHENNFGNGMSVISDLNVHSKPFIPQEEFDNSYRANTNSGSWNAEKHYSRSDNGDNTNSSNFHGTRPKVVNKFKGNKSNRNGYSHPSYNQRYYSKDSRNSNFHQYDNQSYRGNDKRSSNYHLEESSYGCDNSSYYPDSRSRGYPIGQGSYMKNGRRAYNNTFSQYNKQNYNKFDQNSRNYRSGNQSYQRDYQLGNAKFNYKQPRGRKFDYDRRSVNKQTEELKDPAETNSELLQQSHSNFSYRDFIEPYNNKDIQVNEKLFIKEDEKTQKEHMTEALMKGAYECMVCCEKVKQHHGIWSCSNCFNCFHLICIKKWAGTSKEGTVSLFFTLFLLFELYFAV